MIVGLKQKQVGTDKTWDYSGCLYPEGIIDPERLYLFNFEQIERLFFIGFQDGESLKFMSYLRKLDSENEAKEDNDKP